MISFVQTCKKEREPDCSSPSKCSFALSVTCQSASAPNSKLHLHCNKKKKSKERKRAASVFHAGATLVVYIPKKQWRVTGVCVQYKPLSAGQVWVRLSRKQQARKLEKKKNTSLKRIAGISTLRGMHRCRHSAADDPS